MPPSKEASRPEERQAPCETLGDLTNELSKTQSIVVFHKDKRTPAKIKYSTDSPSSLQFPYVVQ